MLAETLTEVPTPCLPWLRIPKQVMRFIDDPKFGGQEKCNGKRRVIVRQDNIIFCFNKKGQKRDLPPALRKVLLKHKLNKFVLDVELEDIVIKVFDALILGDEALAPKPYKIREARCHQEFDNFDPLVRVLKTAKTREEKLALYYRLLAENAEGMVFKNLLAVYIQGDACQHFKVKFWKTVDAFVIARTVENGRVKDSVRIGVYDRKGNVIEISGVSLIGRGKVDVGDVLEVKCLYSTPDNHIVQPVMLQKRDDKTARECTIMQLEIILNKNWMKP